ncbi:uncharacterized protein LOC143302196 [Babylonia areolata]|uniref:uncharacterized protein LOC143302196 n=1 Tax=Babylonia areolata TaxID=304850 RepID=UPI003FD1ED3C
MMERATGHGLDDMIVPSERNVTSDVKFFHDVNILFWRIVPPILMVLGTFGNVMTVVVMRGMRSSQSTACLSVYFTALAVSDQCVLFVSLTFWWVELGYSWPPDFFRFDLLCSVPKFVWSAATVTSAWFLVAMTYQRVISVIVPHRVGVLCTVKRGKFAVAIIVFVSCALNVHFLFTWAYWPEYGQCYFRTKYMHLMEVLEWLVLFCFSVLPFLFLIVGNSILVRQVIKSSQLSLKMRGSVDKQSTSSSSKLQSMSVTLIITSTAYLVFTLPDCVFDIWFEKQYVEVSDGVLETVRSVLAFLWFCAASSNFYLYLLSGSKFRREAKRYLFCHGAD